MELYTYVHILSVCVFLYALTGTGKVLPNPKAAFKFKAFIVLIFGFSFTIGALVLDLIGASSLTVAFLWLTYSLFMAFGLSLENGRCRYLLVMDPKQYQNLMATGELERGVHIIKISDVPETRVVWVLKKAAATSFMLGVISLLRDMFVPFMS